MPVSNSYLKQDELKARKDSGTCCELTPRGFPFYNAAEGANDRRRDTLVMGRGWTCRVVTHSGGNPRWEGGALAAVASPDANQRVLAAYVPYHNAQGVCFCTKVVLQDM